MQGEKAIWAAHVQVLVQGIAGIGTGGVRGGWQDIVQSTHNNDVRGMASACDRSDAAKGGTA